LFYIAANVTIRGCLDLKIEDIHNKELPTHQITELQSLGIDSRRMNDLNDEQELNELAEIIKQAMYQDYKLAYSEKGDKHEAEAESTVKI
jgi:hypothetical protein